MGRSVALRIRLSCLELTFMSPAENKDNSAMRWLSTGRMVSQLCCRILGRERWRSLSLSRGLTYISQDGRTKPLNWTPPHSAYSDRDLLEERRANRTHQRYGTVDRVLRVRKWNRRLRCWIRVPECCSELCHRDILEKRCTGATHQHHRHDSQH